MPPEDENDEKQIEEQETEAKPAADAKSDEEKPVGNVVTMPTSAIGKLKKEERERGAKAAIADLDKRAKALGFKNHDELLAAAAKLRGKGAAAAPAKTDVEDDEPSAEGDDVDPPAETKPQTPAELLEARKAARRAQKMLEEAKQERARLNKQLHATQARLKRAEQQAASQAAELELRIEAAKVGVTDPDFALHLLRKELAGKTPKDLQGFSSSEFFGGLKKARPHLFEPAVEPATAGQSVEANVPANKTVAKAPSSTRTGPPAGGADKKPGSKDSTFDAMKAMDAEYRERLRQHGLAP